MTYGASNASVMAAEVAAVPAVEHAEMTASGGAEYCATAVIPASSSNTVPGVSASVAGIEHGAPEVEVVAVRIAGIDAEVPVAAFPVEWAIEVGGCAEGLPLPVEQDVAHVKVAALPIGSIHVVVGGYAHQIVEVDLVGCLILLVSQVQLVGHLVCQEQSLVACLLVAHCICARCHHQHSYQGHHHLLHIFSILCVIICCLLLLTLQNYEEKRGIGKDFP